MAVEKLEKQQKAKDPAVRPTGHVALRITGRLFMLSADWKRLCLSLQKTRTQDMLCK